MQVALLTRTLTIHIHSHFAWTPGLSLDIFISKAPRNSHRRLCPILTTYESNLYEQRLLIQFRRNGNCLPEIDHSLISFNSDMIKVLSNQSPTSEQ